MGSITKTLGDVAEAAVTLALLKTGNVVLRPVGDNQRYDLVIHREGQFLRIQCKTGRLRTGSVVFNTCSVHGHRGKPAKGYVGDADFFGVFCPELDTTYLVPVTAVGQSSCCLRVDPYKVDCPQGLQAEDYILDGFTLERKKPPKPITRKCVRCCHAFEVAADYISQAFCSVRCSNDRSDVPWPIDSDLRDLVWTLPATRIGKQLGVTSTAVKKHCEARGIQTPGRGYWTKRGPSGQG